MAPVVTFRARLQPASAGGEALFFEVPADVDLRAAFGRARPPVLATLRGHTWRTTPAIRGGTTYLVPNRHRRAATGVRSGDEVEVALALDEEPRTVAVPADLEAALHADAGAAERWERLSHSHRREHVEWIEEAKRPDTRQRRVSRTLERLRDGRSARG